MKGLHPNHPLRRWWKRLLLKDKFLLIFLLLLLIQSALNLFVKNLAISEPSPLDIVIRTTSATIFGYFIGIGFLRETTFHPPKEADDFHKETRPKSNIPGPSTNELLPEVLEHPTQEVEKRYRQQIVIVASIGLVSLSMLLLASNLGRPQTMEATATLSQLRDFVSGSVGFLVGHSAKH